MYLLYLRASFVRIIIFINVVLFPLSDEVPLVGDSMRLADAKYQEEVDSNIRKALQALGVDDYKVYTLESLTISDRIIEVAKMIA
jgi:hypothetical protein